MQARKISSGGTTVVLKNPTGSLMPEGKVQHFDLSGTGTYGIIGVAVRDVSVSTFGAFETGGVFDVALAIGSEVAIGDDIYWGPTAVPVGGASGTGAATPDVQGEYYLGKALAAAVAGTSVTSGETDVVRVLLQQLPMDPLRRQTADVGDENSFLIARSTSIGLTTTSSGEERVLPSSDAAGIQVLFSFTDFGGACQIVNIDGFDSAGHTTINMNSAGSWVLLISAPTVWRVVNSDGCTFTGP